MEGRKDLQESMDEEHAALFGFITKGQISKLALRELFCLESILENDDNLIDMTSRNHC